MRLAGHVDDAPRVRMGLAVFAAALVWLAVLTGIGHWLLGTPTPTPAPAPERPLEMRMVELEPPPPQPAVARPLPAPTLKPSKPVAASPHASPQHAAPKPADTPPLHDATPTSTTATATATAETRPSAESLAPATASAPEKQNATPAAASTGDTAARAIAQPLPELPDDLREQAYQTVATARFTIHTDGSTDVDLIKPTPNPRLNQILLEVLHKWRFFPAMQSGHPVESRQDIRVHFNVD